MYSTFIIKDGDSAGNCTHLPKIRKGREASVNEQTIVKIKPAEDLSSAEKKALLRLVSRCREAEPFTLTLPLKEAGVTVLLLYSDRRLAACLALCPSGGGGPEALAFTHPKYRRRGFFRQLAEEAQRMSDAPPVFIADQSCGNAPAAAKALGLKVRAEELMMERTLRGRSLPDNAGPGLCLPEGTHAAGSLPETAPRAFRIHAFPAEDPEDPSVLYEARSGGTLLLSLLVLPYADRAAYVFAVEVPEALRGRGAGSRTFPAVLRRLKRDGYRRVLVQVSNGNVPAVRLYRRCGFTESLRLTSYA